MTLQDFYSILKMDNKHNLTDKQQLLYEDLISQINLFVSDEETIKDMICSLDYLIDSLKGGG